MVKALSNLKPFRKTETLGYRVREKLRQIIMAGSFNPGEKLTLRAVASALGVSLTPAREALFNLVAEGVLDLGDNGSIYVPRLDKIHLRELVKVRTRLEALATSEAIPLLKNTQILEIEEINNQLIMADRMREYDRLIVLNWRFHFAIYSQSQMPFLVRMIEGCWLRTGSYLNVIYPHFAQTDEGIENHLAILCAIKARDGQAAAEAIVKDIHFSAKALYDSLDHLD